jgi:hypothetical protein
MMHWLDFERALRMTDFDGSGPAKALNEKQKMKMEINRLGNVN